MRKISPLWMLALLLVIGCEKQDPERLTRMARVATNKIQDAAGITADRLPPSWTNLRHDQEPAALGVRISNRLRWDKLMEDSAIEVQVKDGEVELKGLVRDLPQRQRAVDLAANTVGAEKVVDHLTMPETEP